MLPSCGDILPRTPGRASYSAGMDPVTAIAIALALVVVATGVGLLWRARTGRVRTADADPELSLAELAGAHAPLGSAATLVQFSTGFCAPCRSTSLALSELVTRRDGITHVEIDLDARPELVQRLGILQTPTVFVLDSSGRSRGRIGGAPRMPELVGLLDSITGDRHVQSA